METSTHPLKVGLGFRRQKKDAQKTLEVFYPFIAVFKDLRNALSRLKQPLDRPTEPCVFSPLHMEDLDVIRDGLSSSSFADIDRACFRHTLKLAEQFLRRPSDSTYYERDIILFVMRDEKASITSTEEAYFKLHCLSKRLNKPHSLSLENVFEQLPNIAWTNKGPMLAEDFHTQKVHSLMKEEELNMSHVDKFPYLTQYMIPSGVRIASASQVRLGAYLSEGTTVMPSGYVNFNAGTLGKAMIEGRISAGVVIGDNTDIGGGASIMGTLSGGGKEVIRIGRNCLIGANAGTGISLGDGCTIAAGTYITAGTKVALYDAQKNRIDLQGQKTSEGNHVVKARALSGRSHLLFLRDSVTGDVQARVHSKVTELNAMLHEND